MLSWWVGALDLNVWFYEADGRALGPVAETDLAAMLREQRLAVTALVWTEEFGDTWRPAMSTRLVPVAQPPPLRRQSVTPLPTPPKLGIAQPAPRLPGSPVALQPEPRAEIEAIYAWLIAVSPLLILGVDIALTAAGIDVNKHPVSSGISIWSGILMLLAAWKDAQAVERAGLNSERRTLVPFMLLTPIGYFLRRRQVAEFSLTPLWIWLACAAVFAIIEIAMFG